MCQELELQGQRASPRKSAFPGHYFFIGHWLFRLYFWYLKRIVWTRVSEEDKFGGQKTTSSLRPNLLTLSEARFLFHRSICQTSGLVNFWGVSTQGL